MRFLLCVFILYTISAKAQFEKKYSIPGYYSEVYVDPLEHVFLCDKSSIHKFSTQGKKIADFSFAHLGDLSHADVSNPFKILLFFEEFNQIVFLDNYLSEIGEVYLDDLSVNYTNTVCSSENGGFWYYNSQHDKMVLIDENNQVMQQSVRLSTFFGNKSQPSYAIERNSQLYILFPNKGIAQVDQFGGFVRQIHLENASQFQPSNNQISFLSHSGLTNYHFLLGKEEKYPIPYHDFSSGVFVNNYLYLLNKEGLTAFLFNQK